MGSAYGAGAGADMLQQILRQKFSEAIQQQKMAEDIRQANMQNAVQTRQLGQGDQRIALDRDQFDAGAPLRLANVAHIGAETNSLNRQPEEAQKTRNFEGAQATQAQTFQGGQGDLNRSNAVRIANIRKPGDHLQVQPDGKGGLVRIDLNTGKAMPIDMGGTTVQTKDSKVNATTENRLQSAKAVTQTGADIERILRDPKVSQQLGQVMSRYNNVADFVGNAPPEWSELAGAIESYSLANMGVHGMRSATGAEAIRQTLGQGRHTPESIISALKGLNGFSNHLLENNKGWDSKGGPAPAGRGDSLGIRK